MKLILAANLKAKEKQTQHIRRLFHRQLSIPLADLKPTHVAYTAWEDDHGSTNDVNNVVSAYQKALEMLNDRAPFEEKISKKNTDSEKLQEFMVLSIWHLSFWLCIN